MHRAVRPSRRTWTFPGRVSAVGVLVACCATVLAPATPAAAQLPAPAVAGSGPVQLGGYAAVTFARPEHPEEVERPEVSELVAAAMAWGRILPRLSYLVELDGAKRTTDTWTGREADQWLIPVRAYAEYTVSDALRVRVGRFLTPIGQWNERHAEPLTWTPTRPLTTYRPFAKSVGGLLLAGEGTVDGRDAGYALFWSPTGRFGGGVEEAEESSFVRALGGRVAAELRPGVTLGLSAAGVRRSHPRDEDPLDGAGGAASAPSPAPGVRPLRVADGGGEDDGDLDDREEDAGPRALLGADLRWEDARFELLVEGTWLPAHEGAAAEGGAFAQAAVRLAGPLWAVARAETFRPVDDRTVRLGYAGLSVRTSRHLVAKFGRQLSRRPSARIPDGWFLSFSSLF